MSLQSGTEIATNSTAPDCGQGPTDRTPNGDTQQHRGGQQPHLGQSN